MNCCEGQSEQSAQKRRHGIEKSKNRKFAKIVLLGNVAVGKTSITQRYVYEKFEEKYYNTLGGAYVEKNVDKNGQNFQLNIWDTAGDERYRSIMPLYYRDAQAAILVYDVTDVSTFQDLNYWIEELNNKVQVEGMILVLVGNKNDVAYDQKRVTREMADTFAREKRLMFFECSAKTGEGIESIFELIIEKLDFENTALVK